MRKAICVGLTLHKAADGTLAAGASAVKRTIDRFSSAVCEIAQWVTCKGGQGAINLP